MEYLYITLAVIIAIFISVIISEYRSHFCRDCGTKMDRHYDPEEDAEVYQCPCCGRSFLIK